MTKPQPTESMYLLLKRPLITEKTTKMAEVGNWVAFEVDKKATKPQIRAAVETIYGVKVLQVNTLNQVGKTKGMGKNRGRTSDLKKAYIKLKDGDRIEAISA